MAASYHLEPTKPGQESVLNSLMTWHNKNLVTVTGINHKARLRFYIIWMDEVTTIIMKSESKWYQSNRPQRFKLISSWVIKPILYQPQTSQLLQGWIRRRHKNFEFFKEPCLGRFWKQMMMWKIKVNEAGTYYIFFSKSSHELWAYNKSSECPTL